MNSNSPFNFGYNSNSIVGYMYISNALPVKQPTPIHAEFVETLIGINTLLLIIIIALTLFRNK